jgi:hypothetical protein
VTGLIWLKLANCLGANGYGAAVSAVGALADGQCGLTDGSSPGDWRLPTKTEWQETVATAVAMQCFTPSLTNTSGTKCYGSLPVTVPFIAVPTNCSHFSGTANELVPSWFWGICLSNGSIFFSGDKNTFNHIWPVRGGR